MRPTRRLSAISLLVFALFTTAARADVPGRLGYQGRLLKADGAPVSGMMDVTFALFDAETGGAALWTETQKIAFADGFYATSIGAVKGLPPELFAAGARYLEVTIGGDTLSPRQRLDAVPYTLEARNLRGGSVDATSLSVNGKPVVDAQGQLAPGLGYTAGSGLEITPDRHIQLAAQCGPGQTLEWDGRAWGCKTTEAPMTPGAGLAVANGVVSVDTGVVQARVSGSCPEGQYVRVVNADGTVTCGADRAPEYAAGPGLALSGGAFAVDTGRIQSRISDACPPGTFLTAVAADGSVACDAPARYAAADGLTLAGTSLGVDFGLVQARVASSCPQGSSIRAIDAGGAVLCQVDADTTYTAGAGLELNGSSISLPTRCAAGQLLKWDGAGWDCADDADRDTTYGVGVGLLLSGTTIAANTSVLQSRVTGTCPAGSYVREIDASGAVTCGLDADTTYLAGSGLALDGRTLSLQRNCVAGELLKWSGTEWLCAPDDAPRYRAGAGLTLDGSTLAADTTVLQARVAGTCPAGSYVRAIAADGSVTCQLDADTTYAAGAGIELNGRSISLPSGCAAGQLLKWDGSAWACADDTDTDTNTTYAAGAGLTLAGNAFAADTTVLQARVTGACPAGSSIRTIDADGTVTCTVDRNTTYAAGAGLEMSGQSFALKTSCATGQLLKWDGADWACADDASARYTAGSGLVLSGNAFAADTAVLQARVTGACPAGSSIRTIDADGAVTCHVDQDTTYAAGAGIELNGRSISLPSGCTAGQLLKWDGATWACANDADTDTDTTYAAGLGLTLGAGVFSADTRVLQARVTGTCPAGSFVRTISADGSVGCEVDANTTYAAGAGLELNGSSISLATGCAAGQLLKWDGATWSCAGDVDTTYAAGHGLTLTGGTFDVSRSVFQSRIATGCPAGSAIRDVDASGNVTCEIDDDTTYVAGSGLTLAGGALSLVRTCFPGELLEWSGTEWVCAPDDDTINTYAAGAGLTLTGSTFSADTGVVQARVSRTCPAGSAIRAIAADGSVTCELDDDTTYAAGSGIELNGGSISLKTTCTAGQLLKWDGADWTCAGDLDTNTTYTAGSGLTLTGTTFAADTSVLQSRVVGTCPGGSAIKAIDASGNVTCEPMTTYAAGSGLELDGTTFSLTKSCLPGEVLKWSGTAWVCAEAGTIQTISISGNSLSISGGNSVALPSAAIRTAEDTVAPGAGLSISINPNNPFVYQAMFQGRDLGWYPFTSETDSLSPCSECGTGSEGDLVLSSGRTLNRSDYYFSSLKIKSGGYLTGTQGVATTIHVNGDAIIDGTIDFNGLGYSGGQAGLDWNTRAGNGLGPGGGLGYPDSSAANGQNGNHSYGTPTMTAGLELGSGGGGGNAILGGCYGSTTWPGGGGGAGGGAIKIVARRIVVSKSGAIYTNGIGGTPGANGGCAWVAGTGGGGSGGSIWLKAAEIVIDGNLYSQGGAGKTSAAGGGRILLESKNISPRGTTNPGFFWNENTNGLDIPPKLRIRQTADGTLSVVNASDATARLRLTVSQ